MRGLLAGGLMTMLSWQVFATQLHVYAGAGLREPAQKIIAQYEKETGNQVSVEYGGSGQLLARYNITKAGDLFLSGSANYVDKLAKDQQVKERAAIVRHIPVLAIRKDKAGNINSFAKLAQSDLKLGLGDSKAMALGRSGEKLLADTGYGPALMKKVVVRAATVKQLVFYLLNGDVDAAVIGRAGAWKARKKLRILPSPAGAPQEIVTMALLTSSQHPQQAKDLLARFRAASGLKTFTDAGFLALQHE